MIRKSLVLGFLAAAALSQAATFNTISFDSDLGGVSATYSSPTPDSYLASINGLSLNSNVMVADVAWVFQFDTEVPYKSVDLRIFGQSDGGKLDIFASETVIDIKNSPWTTVLETAVESDPGGSFFDVVFHFDPFTYPVTKGEVRKDILFVAENGSFQIQGIEQNFPVPEPASMLALAGGAAALIARRRRK